MTASNMKNLEWTKVFTGNELCFLEVYFLFPGEMGCIGLGWFIFDFLYQTQRLTYNKDRFSF